VTALEELEHALGAGLLWVTRDPGGEPVGFALVEIVDGEPHLEEIDVDPAHGRRGLGRALLEAVLAWASAAGHAGITLTTFRDVAWNAPFYERMGFRALAPNEIGPGLEAIVRDETARGLDPARRVAMRYDLALAEARREYAEKVAALAGLRSSRLREALASVPRESFVGPGPWQILRVAEAARGYQLTPGADPRHLYDNVLVALDASRGLNNGEPAGLLRWLDALELAPGEHFLHVGCGVGYYTALAAHAVAPGEVVGVELDAALAERARANLARWPNVRVVAGDGSGLPGGPFDAVFVNAGATEPLPAWLDSLRPGGRLQVPLTVDLPPSAIAGGGDHLGAGHMLLVTRRPRGHTARFVSPVGIFHCAGARTSDGSARLRRAFERGGQERVRSLRRDAHPEGATCWLHAERFCLSFDAAPE
jgi:protein-L-isoaspartate(D-aspartate) O-methyltransferase